jgi:hypothetical protein
MKRHELEHLIRAAADIADDRFVRAALAGKLVSAETLIERLPAMPIDDSARERIERRIAADKVRGSS